MCNVGLAMNHSSVNTLTQPNQSIKIKISKAKKAKKNSRFNLTGIVVALEWHVGVENPGEHFSPSLALSIQNRDHPLVT